MLVGVFMSVSSFVFCFDHFAISFSESFLMISSGYLWRMLVSALFLVCFVCHLVISSLVSLLITILGCNCLLSCFWCVFSVVVACV